MNRTAPFFTQRLLIYAALGLIILANVLGNLYWLQQNVVQLGHDASAHLTRTLKMAAEFSQPSLGHFLRGLTITDFRPPGLYLAAQPFYWLFGRSIDSAQLANVAIMALILLATFLLGRHLAGPRLALLATAVTALLPMLLAMSRLFYAETLVTLCVVAGLYCLLKSDGFTKRGWSLAWGATLGVGMLAKWTLPVYVLTPMLLVVWQARLWRHSSWPPATRRPVAWRSPAIKLLPAGALALAFTLLLYIVNQAYWAQTLLGVWLPVGWFLLWFGLLILLLLPAFPLTNWLAGLALGAVVAGVWYLPEAGFVTTLSEVAFGTGEGDYKAANWASFNQYFRYFRFFYQHHTGLAVALALLPIGLLPWLWRGRTWLRSLPGAGLLWVTGLSPFFILMLTSQTSSRNLVPILPLFAILVSCGLLAYSRRRRYTLAAVWLVVLTMHWLFATFDGLSSWRDQSSLLWPAQSYSIPPASGITDPAYAIGPDVLQTITDSTTTTTTLGILVDMAQLHPGSFEYPTRLQDLPLKLASLTGPDLRGARDVIANQWIVVKDGDNSEMKAPQRAVVEQLLDATPWFRSMYSLVKSYPFPNNETAYLYRRSMGPPDPYQFSTIMHGDIPLIAAAVNSWWSEQATLAFATPETAVWLGTQDIPIAQAIIPLPNAELLPADLSGVQKSLIVVSRYRTPDFQKWLGQQFRYITEVYSGDFTATLYGHVDEPLASLPVDAAWSPLRIETLQTWPRITAGSTLPLDFTLAGQLDGEWKVSARLVDAAGAVISQQDAAALPGRLSLTLFAPPATPAGAYTLEFVVYNAATLAPLADAAGRPAAPLAVIEVTE